MAPSTKPWDEGNTFLQRSPTQSLGYSRLIETALSFKPSIPSIHSIRSLPDFTMNHTGTQGEPNYTTGLAGVNLTLDTILVRCLVLFLVAIGIVVFSLRLAQLFTAHIRRVHCLHAGRDEQSYWTFDSSSWWPWLKREVIYAPLGRKRHNREWQLSSAVNYGTLPGRVHTIILAFYVLSNMIYCLILPYRREEKAVLIAELRGRAGILATVNMLPLVLMAGRNNPFIDLLKISFDTFNLVHRWIGRIVLVESVVHVLAWYVNRRATSGADGAWQSFHGSAFLWSGLVATLAMAIILLQSLSAIRHAFYETFLHVHQLLAVAVFAGVWIHLAASDLPALPYIRVVVIIWILERVIRLVRIVRLNFNRKLRATTHVVVEAIPGEACRVTFYLPNHVTIRPGSHVYAYLPRIGLWTSHPFSVAWTNKDSEPPTGPATGSAAATTVTATNTEKDKELYPTSTSSSSSSSASSSQSSTSKSKRDLTVRSRREPTTVSLVMAARSGLTRRTYERARSSPEGTLHTFGLLEGPYAGHDSLASYGTVVMFAGGAGITHHLVQIRHLIACAYARTVATRRIVLVWSVRDLEALTWVQPWMDDILKMPGRREVLSLSLYVTKPRGPADYTSPSSSIKLQGGRCCPGGVLDDVLLDRVGATMVTVCGPGAFADEVRAAVRARLHVGCIDMNEESFTW